MALTNMTETWKQPQPAAPVRENALTPEDERNLSHRWRTQEDSAALARLIQSHLGLVIRIARDFRHSGPPMEDLIQEGNVGLTIAARRFDSEHATRLSTYATYWIRACILEHVVRTHGPVRIGTTRSQRKIFFGLGRARRKIEQNGVTASNEELAGALGVETADVDAMTPRLNSRDLSLDAPIGADDRRHVGDGLATAGADPEEMVGDHEADSAQRARLRAGLKTLDKRERAIVEARFLRSEPASLAELGAKFGISRERVRQLEARALDRLRQVCPPLGA